MQSLCPASEISIDLLPRSAVDLFCFVSLCCFLLYCVSQPVKARSYYYCVFFFNVIGANFPRVWSCLFLASFKSFLRP